MLRTFQSLFLMKAFKALEFSFEYFFNWIPWLFFNSMIFDICVYHLVLGIIISSIILIHELFTSIFLNSQTFFKLASSLIAL